MQALLKTAVIYPVTALLVMGCTSATSSRGVESRIAFEAALNIRCVSTPRTQQTWIIRTEAEYRELFLNKLSIPACTQYVSPPIDFSKKTLLGYVVSTGGCKMPGFRTEILYNRSSNRYTLLVNATQYGTCKMLYEKTFWITIPKIKKGSKIDFKVVEQVLP